ncbi:MAG: Crp/Fnr family transcriptional regulator [Myxococcales bacterium]|nr:Crp/Fnr family transcriptional regulator [Myxococcales bacterium]
MDVRSVLRRHPAFARLGEEALDSLSRLGAHQRLRRGEAVWRAGERASAFVLVGHGLVKVLLPGGASRDLVLGLAGPGESVGDALVLEGGTYDADAYALTDSVVVVRVPRDAALLAFEKHGAAAMELARTFGHASTVAARRLALFTASAEERLATTLMELGERFGDELEDGTTLIPLRLTRAELAALVGTTVETTIRTLSRWTREGLVSTGESGMTLHDATALARRSSLPAVARA